MDQKTLKRLMDLPRRPEQTVDPRTGRRLALQVLAHAEASQTKAAFPHEIAR